MSWNVRRGAWVGIVSACMILNLQRVALSETQGQDPHTLFYQGLFHELGLGDLEGAIRTYRVISKLPRDGSRRAGEALIREGICFDKMGKEKEALSCYREAIALSPENATLLEKSLSEMAVFFPRSSPIFVRDKELENLIDEGNQCAARGDLEGAQDKFQKALYLNPDNPQLQLQLASTYKKLGRHREAIFYYNLALGSEIYRDDLAVYRDLAACYAAAGDPDSAIKLWRSYLASGAADTSARTMALFELELLHEATDRPAGQAIPQELAASLANGEEQTRRGHYQQALHTYKAARVKFPGSYLPFYRLGVIYDYLLTVKQKSDYVIYYYKEALKGAPPITAQRLRYRLALIYEERGDIENASRYIEQYFSKNIRPAENDNLLRERIRKKWERERIRKMRERS